MGLFSNVKNFGSNLLKSLFAPAPAPKPAPVYGPPSPFQTAGNVGIGSNAPQTKITIGSQPAVAGVAKGPVYGPPSPVPSTGGQAAAPSGSSGSSGSNNSGNNGTIPVPSNQPTPPQDNGLLDIIKANYANARGGIEALNPQLDQGYNLAKGDINTAVTDAETAANTRKVETDKQFGDILKNQLQTYQDLGRQRQGIFSNLGTLDSSAFGEQQFRADQALAEGKTATDLEHVKTTKSIDDSFASYKKNADSELGKLALSYQSGKNAIAQALSQGNINEAGALTDELNRITDRANELKTNMQNWATTAAILKTQGVDVIGALNGISGNGYAGTVNGQLNSAKTFGSSLIPSMIGGPQGSGYIGSGAGLDPQTRKLLGLPA